NLLEPLESRLRAAPEFLRRVRAVRLASNVVSCRSAAEGKAAVAATGAFGDSTRVVHADAQPAPGECERARHAGDPGADDRDVDVSLRTRVDRPCRDRKSTRLNSS